MRPPDLLFCMPCRLHPVRPCERSDMICYSAVASFHRAVNSGSVRERKTQNESGRPYYNSSFRYSGL